LKSPLVGWGLNPTLPEGLPDACIYTDNGWILIIESKVAARVSINQLNRHINTLKRRGFTDIQLLVINMDKNVTKLPDHTIIKTWSEIYEWGYKHIQKTTWAKQFTGYFEVAEAKNDKDEYFTMDAAKAYQKERLTINTICLHYHHTNEVVENESCRK